MSTRIPAESMKVTPLRSTATVPRTSLDGIFEHRCGGEIDLTSNHHYLGALRR